jgi:hypothetical protein
MTHYRIVKTKCTVKNGWTGTRVASESMLDSDSLEASRNISVWLGGSLKRSNEKLFDYYKETLK